MLCLLVIFIFRLSLLLYYRRVEKKLKIYLSNCYDEKISFWGFWVKRGPKWVQDEFFQVLSKIIAWNFSDILLWTNLMIFLGKNLFQSFWMKRGLKWLPKMGANIFHVLCCIFHVVLRLLCKRGTKMSFLSFLTNRCIDAFFLFGLIRTLKDFLGHMIV